MMKGKSRQLTSQTWKYFERREDEWVARCKLCKPSVTLIKCSGGCTSGLKKHLGAVHGVHLKSRPRLKLKIKTEICDDNHKNDDNGNEDDAVMIVKPSSSKRFYSLSWMYFRRQGSYARCKLCPNRKFIKCSGGVTSGLLKHLSSIHGLELTPSANCRRRKIANQLEVTEDEEDDREEGTGEEREVDGAQLPVKSEPCDDDDYDVQEREEEQEPDGFFGSVASSPKVELGFESSPDPDSPSEFSSGKGEDEDKSRSSLSLPSLCWNYFKRESDDDDGVRCKMCRKWFKSGHCKSTALMRHVRNFHRIENPSEFHTDDSSPQKSETVSPVPCFMCLGTKKGIVGVDGESKGGGGEDHWNASPETSLEESVLVIFALTKMFGIGGASLESFLLKTKGKNPNEWVKLCRSCKTLVADAYRLDIKIRKMTRDRDKLMSVAVGRITESKGAEKRFHKAKEEFFVAGEVRKMVMMLGPVVPPPAQLSSLPEGEDADERFEDDDDDDLGNGGPSHSPKAIPMETIEIEKEVEQEIDLGKGQRKSASKWILRSCPSCPKLKSMPLNEFIQHLIFHWMRPRKCSKCEAYLPDKEADIGKHWEIFHPTDASDAGALTEKSVAFQFDPGSVWKCQRCDLRFKTFQERDDHESIEHLFSIPKDIVCSECSHKFRSISEVRLHKALDHPEKAALNCFYCDKSFSSCTRSGATYRDVEEMKPHIKEKHLSRPMGASSKRLAIGVVEPLESAVILQDCPLCGMVFKEASLFHLRNHLRDSHEVHDPTKVFYCPLCTKGLTPLQQWLHLRRVHCTPSVCDVCGKEMKPVQLAAHKYKEHGVLLGGHQVYKCGVEGCQYETLYSSYLKKHLENSHDGDDGAKQRIQYTCQFCGKKVGKLNSLRAHEAIHINEKTRPFKCDLCGARFAVRTYLYIHKRTVHERSFFPSTFKRRKGFRSSSKSFVGKPNSAEQVNSVVPSPQSPPLGANVGLVSSDLTGIQNQNQMGFAPSGNGDPLLGHLASNPTGPCSPSSSATDFHEIQNFHHFQ